MKTMTNGRQVQDPDLEQCLDLIQKGKLFALQAWIKDGRPVRFSTADPACSPLRVAVGTGFHSVVKELIRVDGWSSSDLSDALEIARTARHYEIAELLERYGARPEPLDFETCCEKLDLFMMERHLRAGTDPGKENVFAQVLSAVKARPLLRFYRQFRIEFPALDDQAALALTEAVKKEHVRWAALLAWAGADPFRNVPNDLSEPFPVDPENCTSAAKEAVWHSNPDILKVLHLKPRPAQALDLLSDAAYHGNFKLFQNLLNSIPRDQINDTPRSSSAALEQLVNRWSHRCIYAGKGDDKGSGENIRCVEMLLDFGARWNPPLESLRRIRKNLLGHEARYIVQILRLLLYTPGAINLEAFLELCRSSTLGAKIAMADAPLVQELKHLRKRNKSVNTSIPDAVASADLEPQAKI